MLGGLSPDWPPDTCVSAHSWPPPIISASIQREQMAAWPGVGGPTHDNNRPREDDEAGSDTARTMPGRPGQTLKTGLCLPLREAAVDICCLLVGFQPSLLRVDLEK